MASTYAMWTIHSNGHLFTPEVSMIVRHHRNTRVSLLRRRIIHLEDLEKKKLMARLKIVEKDNEIMTANTGAEEKL
ncbi:hypothetical protein E2C01_057921 [Portunus trituberculatus]|uniref:Uncharacterized protein n=1 Tax=Portunus trituberculatus TaxID=210409 RepID=A0A5B7H2E2_PORTR|nr:hypothetical protein [Portunus trituberculatus]